MWRVSPKGIADVVVGSCFQAAQERVYDVALWGHVCTHWVVLLLLVLLLVLVLVLVQALALDGEAGSVLLVGLINVCHVGVILWSESIDALYGWIRAFHKRTKILVSI